MAAKYDSVLAKKYGTRRKLRLLGLLPPVPRSKEFLEHQPIREMINQGARMSEIDK